MTYYDPYRRDPRRQPTRTLTLDQIQQIEATLQELEQEAAKWKELARKWEAAAKEEHQKASQLEEQLQEQQDKLLQAAEQAEQDAEQDGEALAVFETKQAQTTSPAEVKGDIARMQAHLAQAQADYENAKQRLETRFANLLDQNMMEFLRDLLPVLDNLDRAIQHAPADQENEGVKMTRQMFLSTLDKYGVKPIQALGRPFNPEFHEALGTMDDSSLAPGSVAVVEQPGFMYRDKLLRPARVLITPDE
jgi:molecular chaperone GrpE